MDIEDDNLIYLDSPLTQSYPTYIPPREFSSFYSQVLNSKLVYHENGPGSLSNVQALVQSQVFQEQSSKNKNSYKSHCKGKAHLRRLSAPVVSESQSCVNLVATGKAIKSRPASSTSKRPTRSALSSRSAPYTHSQHFLRPIGTASRARPQTAFQKTPTKKDPLVIYPFESKLKAKRVDDNPKILEQIIAYKHRNNSKQQLYTFIERIMQRKR